MRRKEDSNLYKSRELMLEPLLLKCRVNIQLKNLMLEKLTLHSMLKRLSTCDSKIDF